MPHPGRLVLDTSAYSHLRGGDERVADAMANATHVLIPTPVVGEMEAGFELGGRAADNRARLAELLTAPFVSVLPVTTDVARVYGRLFARLRRQGTPIGTNDIWIAACTIDAGGHLLTFDADFEHITGLDMTLLDARPQAT